MSYVATKLVQTAMITTKETFPDMYLETLSHKICLDTNNYYEQFFSIMEIELAIMSANWTEVMHPALLAGQRLFRANIDGHVGIVNITNSPVDTIFQADDPIGSKKVSLVISEEANGISNFINETYIIINPNLHICSITPNTPIKKSIRKTSIIRHGEPLTRNTALYLGWEWARII